MSLSLSIQDGAGRLINAAQDALSSRYGITYDTAYNTAQTVLSSMYGASNTPLGGAVSQASQLEGTPEAQSEWLLCLPDGSAIPFDTILRIDVDSSNQTMQAPTEMGSFAMYNKVVTPTSIDLQVGYSGRYSSAPDAERQRVTKLLMDLSCTNDLLTLITPEMEFSGYNLESVRYTRSPDDGVDVIYFELQLIEVRQVSGSYGNAKLAPKVQKGQQNGEQSALSGIGDYLGF